MHLAATQISTYTNSQYKNFIETKMQILLVNKVNKQIFLFSL